MAQIKLTITADTQGVQKSVEQIKNQFTALSQQLSKLTVNKDLTAQIDSLSRYYETLATAASKTRNSATKTTAQVDTLRKSYANLALQIKTLKGQSAGGAFDGINKQVEANLKSVQALSEAYKNGNWGDEQAKELKTLSDGYKSLAADVSEVRLANEKASVTEPFSPKLIDSLYRVQSRFESLKTTISGVEKYYPKGTFSGITAEIDKNVASLKALEGEYQATGKLSQQSVDKFNGISRAVLEQDAAFKQTRNSATNYHGSIRDIIAGFAKFQLSAMLVMKPLQMMQNALSSINETLVETENAVISISRVLDENISNGEIADEIYRIAQSLGQTFDVVQEIAQNFAKAGLDWQDTLKATEAAVLALNVAELDAAEASEGLIAIMQQFGYEAEDLTYIIDVLNKTADKSAVDTQELLAALQKTGSYAKESNLTLEQTVALITAISEATAASGQNIGNALKSLFAYSSKDSALDVFAALSPDMDAVVGEYRKGAASILDVWRQLSNEINSLSAEQGKLLDQYFTSEEGSELEEALGGDLAEIQDSIKGVYDSAGVYRKNYFIALLSNMEEVDNVLGDLSNVAGYTMTEQEKYMETYTAKVNALKSQWQALVNDEQGILGFKKLLVDVGSGILTVMEWTGSLRTTFIALGTTLFSIFAPKLYSSISSFINSIKTMVTAFKTAAVTAQTMGTAIQSALGIIGLVTTAVSALVGVIEQSVEKQEEARQATIDAWNAEKDRAAELSQLYSKFLELDEIQDKNAEQEQEYKSLQEGIVELLGERATSLERLTAGTDAYREALAKLTKEEIEENAENAEAARNALGGAPTVERPEGATNSLGALSTSESGGASLFDRLAAAGFDTEYIYRNDLYGGSYRQIHLEGENDYQTLDNINRVIDWLYENNETDNTLYNDLIAYRRAYEDAISSYLETYASADAWEYLNVHGIPQSKEEIDSIVNSVIGVTGATESWRDEIENIVISITGFEEETEDTTDGIKDQEDAVDDLTEKYDDLISKLQELKDAQKDAWDWAESKQDVIDAQKELEEAEKALQEAQEAALQNNIDLTDEQNDLLEAQNALLKARQALERVKNERTVRRFSSTGNQWEWQADEDKVADAQEALLEAQDDLLEAQQDIVDAQNDAKEKLQEAIEDAQEDLENAQEQLAEAQYKLEQATYEKIIEDLEKGLATNESIEAILQEIKPLLGADSTLASDIANAIQGVFGDEGLPDGTDDKNDGGDKDSGSSSSSSGGGKPSGAIGGGGGKFAQSQLYYDSGGVAKGRGLFAKDTDRHESIINDPDLTEKILSPVPSKQFDRYVRDMGILFEHARVYEQSPVMRSVVGNTDNSIDNSRQVIIKDVNVGAQKRDSLVDALGLAALVD